MSPNPELITRIDAASREEVLEAARFFAHKLSAGSGADLETARALARGFERQPFAHVAGLEQLSRVILRAGAHDAALAADVALALDGAAHKQFVLGGVEIVALAALAVVALKIIYRRGAGDVSKSTRITMHADGCVIVAVDESSKAITLADDLAAIVRGTIGKKDGA